MLRRQQKGSCGQCRRRETEELSEWPHQHPHLIGPSTCSTSKARSLIFSMQGWLSCCMERDALHVNRHIPLQPPTNTGVNPASPSPRKLSFGVSPAWRPESQCVIPTTWLWTHPIPRPLGFPPGRSRRKTAALQREHRGSFINTHGKKKKNLKDK